MKQTLIIILISWNFCCFTQVKEKYLPDSLFNKHHKIISSWGRQIWDTYYYSDSNSIEPYFMFTQCYYPSGRIRKVVLSTQCVLNDSCYYWSADSTITFYDSTTSPIKSASNHTTASICKDFGTTFTYFKSGQLQSKITFGHMSFIKHKYYKNGQLQSLISYIDIDSNIRNVLEYYDIHGRQLDHGTLNNGKGLLYIYSKDGALLRVDKYRKGKLKRQKIV